MRHNILFKIKQEQREILNLVARVEKTSNNSERAKFYREMKNRLMTALQSENKFFHENFKSDKKNAKKLQALKTADHDQHDIKDILQRLNLMNFDSPRWLHEFKDFKKHFADYIQHKNRVLSY